MHIRACAEQKSIEHVLGDLVGEASDTARRINLILAEDPELLSFWNKYMQASLGCFLGQLVVLERSPVSQYYLEFHLKTPRYRLTELGFHA